MNSISERLPALAVNFLLLGIILLSFSACDEEFLAKLSQEQREILYSYIGVQPSPLQVEPVEEEELLIPEEPLVEKSYSEYSVSLLSEDDQCETLLLGAPRGLACLHCMQPEARHQANILATVLFRSCLKNVAINYLVDGSFSFDEDLLKEHITLLSSNGRRLFLHLYLTNGPSQRRWSQTAVEGFGTKMSPEEFRNRIVNDPALQYSFQQLLLRLIPVLELASSRGAVLSMVPALEDNLSNEAFDSLVDLSLETLPNDMYVSFGRNPCVGCYKGNEGNIPAGMFYETHGSGPQVWIKDAVVTNDGVGYTFYDDLAGQNQNLSSSDISLEDLALFRDAAAEKNNIFILWKSSRQGLPQFPNTVALFDAPSKRIYEIPSLKERVAILDFLREGLSQP